MKPILSIIDAAPKIPHILFINISLVALQYSSRVRLTSTLIFITRFIPTERSSTDFVVIFWLFVYLCPFLWSIKYIRSDLEILFSIFTFYCFIFFSLFYLLYNITFIFLSDELPFYVECKLKTLCAGEEG